MEFSFITNWIIRILILAVCGFLIYLIWRVRVKKPYQFEIIFMKSGFNDHVFIRGDSLDFTHDHDSKKYTIKSDRLYRVKPSIAMRVYFKLVGISQGFLIVFQKGKKIPVSPADVKISSRVLNEVKESRALDKALKNEFHVQMDLKRIIIILGVVILGIVIYLVATGQVVI